MSVDPEATRKLNELLEALDIRDDDLLYVVRAPYTADTSFKLKFSTLRTAISTLVGGPLQYRLLGLASGVSLTGSPAHDLTPVSINAAKYIPMYVVIYNVSAAAAAAELGLFSAPGGGGVEIVAPTVLSALSAPGRGQVLPLVAGTAVPLTAAQLYPRLTVAAPVAATASIAIYGIQLPS